MGQCSFLLTVLAFRCPLSVYSQIESGCGIKIVAVFASAKNTLSRHQPTNSDPGSVSTAPHSFNMLQQCAKEQKPSVFSRKHSTTVEGTLCTRKLAQRRTKGHVTIQMPPHHNASPLRAQNSANLTPKRPRDDRATLN